MDFAQYQRDLDRLRDQSPWNLIVLRRVESTNTLARRITAEYHRELSVPPRSVIVALEQTAGRGRRGRSWTSPAGTGIYATLVLPLPDPKTMVRLPLVVAVGLARTLNRHLDPPCRLHWPNDLVVGDRKLGGLLIEAVSHDEGAVAMIGFGVNHGASPRVPGRAVTCVVESAPEPPSQAALFWELVGGVEEALSHLDDAEWAVSHYRALTTHRMGEHLTCRVAGEERSGVFRGIDDHGFLKLEYGGREERFSAGEVVEESPAQTREEPTE